ncbi:MAG: UBP-type zinc finger domain-containing protein [Terracidiphilus sp.]|jgi:hypothetical protein
MQSCSHLSQIQNLPPKTDGCEECLRMGDSWVHLRLCEICGHVGCCDSSKNRHATKHFKHTKHPIVRSLEPGEDWGWCYIDEIMIEPFPRALEAKSGGRSH